MCGRRTKNLLAPIVVVTLLICASLATRASATRLQLANPTPLQARLSGTWRLTFPDEQTQSLDRQEAAQIRHVITAPIRRFRGDP
jgi:hypothetical protein